MKCICEKVSFDRWMSDIWAVMDEQPIHLIYTHHCITRTAGTPWDNVWSTNDLKKNIHSTLSCIADNVNGIWLHLGN